MALTHGWIPVATWVISVALVLVATGWRTQRWRTVWVPFAALVGVAVAGAACWFIADQGIGSESTPTQLWGWIALAGLAATVLVVGWRASPWWRRGASVLAVPLCLLCAALTVNASLNYLPTVRSAWDRLTGAPLPGEVDDAALAQRTQQGGSAATNTLVSVNIPDTASGFAHRAELVYLPPAWYRSEPPPRLPVVMMIGGEFGHPTDWLEAGDAQRIIDEFADAHGGMAPVLVFVDYSGSFSNDTECVNGVRGNAADHLIEDVVPYLISRFGASSDPSNWGIVGWSSGGTCAVTLSVMHPEVFSAFVDIDGQLGPNAGTRAQTVARLFGGDTDAWAAFDPLTVIDRHGSYTGMSGWLAVSADTATRYFPPDSSGSAPADVTSGDRQSEDHVAVASQLCEAASGNGIECAVVPVAGGHDFSSAAKAFATALPWLAAKLGTPGAAPLPMPGA